ncbi:MAG: sugar transferase [Proteobacteria bacterium]|nr:sugar transferase [Pseudomonadota bacterium]
MKRIFDLILSLCLVSVLLFPILVIAVLVKLTSTGPALYWSDRVGINNEIFKMPKFRTMRTDTPAVATHLLKNPGAYMTPFGYYLRKFSLDEFPQLWSIFKGDMSFVGPRPALYNQDDLIALRTSKGIHQIIPGITGWAQINGRDDIPIPQKVEYDEYYFKKRSFLFDLKILHMTMIKVIKAEGVRLDTP